MLGNKPQNLMQITLHNFETGDKIALHGNQNADNSYQIVADRSSTTNTSNPNPKPIIQRRVCDKPSPIQTQKCSSWYNHLMVEGAINFTDTLDALDKLKEGKNQNIFIFK